MQNVGTPRAPHVAPNLVRWGAVFAGTIISLGFFSLLSALWLAIAYGDADAGGWVSGNLEWFLGGTAVAALFLAGLLSGFLSGVRGAGSGLMNGLTAWGLLFVASVLTVVPGLTAITSGLGAGLTGGTNALGQAGGVTAESAVWTTFWSLLIGAAVAALGGVVGGAMKRDAKVADTDVRGEDDDAYPAAPVTSVATDRVTDTHVVSGGLQGEETRNRR